MSESVDLSVNLANIKLRNPFIVGSGPTVKNADQIREAQDNGWAGVSIKLAIDPFPYINLPPRYRWLKKQKMHIFTAEDRSAFCFQTCYTSDIRGKETEKEIVAK